MEPLADLSALVTDGFLSPVSPELPRQSRLACLLPALSYCGIHTAEVEHRDGRWQIGVSQGDKRRLDSLVASLKEVGGGRDERIAKVTAILISNRRS